MRTKYKCLKWFKVYRLRSEPMDELNVLSSFDAGKFFSSQVKKTFL